MRQGPHNKRGRGRGGNRRVGAPSRNQTFDSNGPDVRIRGNAHQVHEKYLTLARDASASGDRVLAESYFQHAEHYYRILNAFSEEGGGDGNRPRTNGSGDRQVYDGEQPQPDIVHPPIQRPGPAEAASRPAPGERDPASPDAAQPEQPAAPEPAKPTLSLRRRSNGSGERSGRSGQGAESGGSGVTVKVIEPGAEQPETPAMPQRRVRSETRTPPAQDDQAPGSTGGSED